VVVGDPLRFSRLGVRLAGRVEAFWKPPMRPRRSSVDAPSTL